MDSKVKYAIQLSMLKKLKNEGMVNSVEYKRIIDFLKKKYKQIDIN